MVLRILNINFADLYVRVLDVLNDNLYYNLCCWLFVVQIFRRIIFLLNILLFANLKRTEMQSYPKKMRPQRQKYEI